MNTIWMRKPVHQGVGMRYTVCRKAMAVLLSLLMLLSCVGCGLGKTASETTWGRADAKEIDVNSKVAGRVVELLVKEGDTVEAGQVIARIDKRSLEAQKTELEASIEAVRAQQSQAAVTTNMQQGATQSALSQAQSAADRARQTWRLRRPTMTAMPIFWHKELYHSRRSTSTIRSTRPLRPLMSRHRGR